MEIAKKEGRGGRREGAGRKAQGKVSQNFRLKAPLLEALKAKAEMEGTSVVCQLEAALEAYLS